MQFKIIFLILILNFWNFSKAVPAIPADTAKGVCSGRQLITQDYGIFSDHIGPGNYTRGILCEFLLQIPAANSLTLQILPNSIFAGEIWIFEGDNNSLVDDRWIYVGFSPWDIADDRILSSEWSMDYFFSYLPYPAYSNLQSFGTTKGNSWTINLQDANISSVLVQLRTDSLSDVDDDYPNYEQFPGMSFLWWTNGAPDNLLCNGEQIFSISTETNIYDGWGGIYHSLGSYNDARTAQTCRWVITVENADFGLTIKTFQPVTDSELRITLDDRTWTFNKSSRNCSITDPLCYSTVPGDAAPESYAYFLWYKTYLYLPEGSVVTIEYDVPLTEEPDLEYYIDGSTGIHRTSGFLINLFPETADSCYDHTTKSKSINFPNGNEKCLWISDSLGGPAMVPTDFNNTLFCAWTLSLTVTDPIAIYFRDLNLGSASTDTLTISANLDSGPVNLLISDDPRRLPPLLFFPQQQYPKQWTINYDIRSGGGRGFILLFTTETDLPLCLSARKPDFLYDHGDEEEVSAGEIAIIAMNSTTDVFYSLTAPSQQTITSYWITDGSALSAMKNRVLFHSSKSYILDDGSEIPDADNRLVLIRTRSFGLSLPSVSLMLFYFFPDIDQQSYIPPISRLSSSEETNYTFSVLDLSSKNYFLRSSLLTDRMDYDFMEFESSLDWITDNFKSEIRSIDVCQKDKLVIAAVDKSTIPKSYNILTVVYNETTGIYQSETNIIKQSTVGSNYGMLLGSSPSCAWVVTSHSPQMLKIFLKTIVNVRGTDQTKYNWRQFYAMPPDEFIKDLQVEEDAIFLLSCSISYGFAILDYWTLYTWEEELPDWTAGPDEYKSYLDILYYSSFILEDTIEFPWLTCEQESMLAMDIFRTDKFALGLIGRPGSTTGGMITLNFLFNWDGNFNDFFDSVHFNYTNYPQASNLLQFSEFTITVLHESDPLFGMDVDLVYVGERLTEIMILGSRLYLFRIDSFLNQILKNPSFSNKRFFSALNDSFIQETASRFEISFFPNRFSFAEDWTKFYHTGEQMFTFQSANTLSVLFNTHPGNQEEFLNATRSVPRSSNGTQVNVIDNGKRPAKTFISKKENFSPFFTYVPDICPPGSYNPSNGFSNCLLCPAGTYQNESGSTSCLPCSLDVYCPLGAISPRTKISSKPDNFNKVEFTTGASTTVDILVWSAMFKDIPWLTIPLYVCWSLLIVCAIMVVFDPLYLMNIDVAPRKAKDPPEKKGHSHSKKKVKNCLIWADPAKLEYYDPAAKEFREKGNMQNSLISLATIICLLLAFVYILFYYYQYQQYTFAVGKDDNKILNNQRTSSLKPYFTATDDETALLNYLRSRGLIFELLIKGFSRADCPQLCNRTLNPDAISSVGCIPKEGKGKFECNLEVDGCRVTWALPPVVDLLPISSFTFSLGNVIIQELEVKISIAGEDSPQISTLDLSENTVKISPAFIVVPLQLNNPEFLLFDISRQYELNYVLQTSESILLGSSGTPSSDWKMTAVILPLQDSVISASTSDQQYFGTSTANKITLQFSKPNFYIGNVEGRIYQSGALFLTLVNVLAGILGIFQLFGALIGKTTALGKEAIEGKLIKQRELDEEGNIIKSARYDRSHYDPYDIDSLIKALVEHDFPGTAEGAHKTTKKKKKIDRLNVED